MKRPGKLARAPAPIPPNRWILRLCGAGGLAQSSTRFPASAALLGLWPGDRHGDRAASRVARGVGARGLRRISITPPVSAGTATPTVLARAAIVRRCRSPRALAEEPSHHHVRRRPHGLRRVAGRRARLIAAAAWPEVDPEDRAAEIAAEERRHRTRGWRRKSRRRISPAARRDGAAGSDPHECRIARTPSRPALLQAVATVGDRVGALATIALEAALRRRASANVRAAPGTSGEYRRLYFCDAAPGDTLMGMDLSCGGHLTHGHRCFLWPGRDFSARSPTASIADTERIDYDEVERLALGASSEADLSAAPRPHRPTRAIDSFLSASAPLPTAGSLPWRPTAHIRRTGSASRSTRRRCRTVISVIFEPCTDGPCRGGSRGGVVDAQRPSSPAEIDLLGAFPPDSRARPAAHLSPPGGGSLRRGALARLPRLSGGLSPTSAARRSAFAAGGLSRRLGRRRQPPVPDGRHGPWSTAVRRRGRRSSAAGDHGHHEHHSVSATNSPMVASGIRKRHRPWPTTRGMQGARDSRHRA